MRNFIISFSFLIIIISIWTCFSLYSSKATEKCVSYADTLVSQSIVNEDWISAETQFSVLVKTWIKYKKYAYFFLDAKELNEIDGTIYKAGLYLDAHDVSNSSGEIAYLKNKINTLHQSDTLKAKNIF